MSQAATETESTTTSETAGETSAGTSEATETEQIEGYDALGDAGKQALDRMKAERDAALAAAKAAEGDPKAAERIKADRAALRKANDDLAALQAKIDGREAEYAAEQAKRETEQAALAKANGKILRSEIKAAAKGVLADPADAYKFLDLDSFEVSDDGDVDVNAINEALKSLIDTKPYLAAQGGRFQGSADGGARNGAGTSIDDQIAEATKAGNHQLAIALKQRRAAEIAAKKS